MRLLFSYAIYRVHTTQIHIYTDLVTGTGIKWFSVMVMMMVMTPVLASTTSTLKEHKVLQKQRRVIEATSTNLQ